MSLTRASLAYEDCYRYFEEALTDPKGVRIKLESMDAATYLRMRMHHARSLNRRDNITLYDEGHPMHGVSEYDKLVIRIKQDDKHIYLYLEPVDVNVEAIEKLSEVEDNAVRVIEQHFRPPLQEVAQATNVIRRRLG